MLSEYFVILMCSCERERKNMRVIFVNFASIKSHQLTDVYFILFFSLNLVSLVCNKIEKAPDCEVADNLQAAFLYPPQETRASHEPSIGFLDTKRRQILGLASEKREKRILPFFLLSSVTWTDEYSSVIEKITSLPLLTSAVVFSTRQFFSVERYPRIHYLIKHTQRISGQWIKSRVYPSLYPIHLSINNTMHENQTWSIHFHTYSKVVNVTDFEYNSYALSQHDKVKKYLGNQTTRGLLWEDLAVFTPTYSIIFKPSWLPGSYSLGVNQDGRYVLGQGGEFGILTRDTRKSDRPSLQLCRTASTRTLKQLFL